MVAVTGCSHHTSTLAPPAVVVALPVHAQPDAAGSLKFPAEVAARYANPLSFRVAGKIIDRAVRLGDRVHKDQLLAQLDAADARQQAASAQAALDAATHRMTFAQQQLDRDNAQASQNLIAAAQLEQTQDAFTAALDARAQAAAQLTVAQNNLQYTSLRADHDGVITSENADTGQVVAPGQAVYGLAWSGDIDITLDAPESRLADFSVGQHATVSFQSLPDRHFEARVREIAPAADAQSRTYRVKLSLTASGSEVRLGMTGDVSLTPAEAGTASQSFIVPATAIFHQGAQPAVWVINPKDSSLELRPVSASRYNAQSATVTGGLRDGEQVVMAGVHTVYAGEKVRAVAPLFSNTETPGRPHDPGVAAQ
jgi:RND family efflux transporter MFP subunit